MIATMAVATAVAARSPIDILVPWHDLTRGAGAVSRLVSLAVFVSRVLWIIFLVPTALAFVDALRRPEYLYPHSRGYSKTLWIIALAAGFVFNISWLVDPLYLFLVYLRGRRQLGIAAGPTKIISTEPPSRPFKP